MTDTETKMVVGSIFVTIDKHDPAAVLGYGAWRDITPEIPASAPQTGGRPIFHWERTA